MSISSSDNSSLASIGANAGIPSLNVADIPANIRNGNAAAKQAYTEGLAFEQVLVNELTTQLANTMSSSSTDSSDSSDSSDPSASSSSASSGLLSGSGASAYSSLIPQALTTSIMSDGGLGMAEQFAQELDPALNAPAAATTGTANTAVTTDAATTTAAAGTTGTAGTTGVTAGFDAGEVTT
jgi:hypothetical protein